MSRVIKLPRPPRTSARIRVTLVMHPKQLAELEAKARAASMSLTAYFAALLASDDEDVHHDLAARKQVLGEVLSTHKKRRKRPAILAGMLAAVGAVALGCGAPCPVVVDGGVSPDAAERADAGVAPSECASYPAVDVIPADLDWLRAHTMPRVHGCELHTLQREAPAALLDSFTVQLGAVSECAPLWRVRDEVAACVIAWEER